MLKIDRTANMMYQSRDSNIFLDVLKGLLKAIKIYLAITSYHPAAKNPVNIFSLNQLTHSVKDRSYC